MIEKLLSWKTTNLENMASSRVDRLTSDRGLCRESQNVSLLVFVILLLSAGTLLAQNAHSNIPPLTIPYGVGVNTHFVNGASMWSNKQNVQDASYGPLDRHMLDMIAAAGIKIIRTDFNWENIEFHKGVYDWAPYDTLVMEMDKRGLRALFILAYNNTLYASSTKSAPTDSADVAAYAAFAAAAAKHFEGHHIIWEIWNEPNNTINWEPLHSAPQYAALVAATSKAMRKADPNATIIAPAMAGVQFNILDSLFQEGILKYINAVSLHPYRDNPPPPRVPETVGPDFANVRTLINKYEPAGDTIPIVSSEWGYSTVALSDGVSRQTQADYFARMQLFNLYSGAPLSIWYDWKNDGLIQKIGRHRGLVDYYLDPKPAYVAATVLTREFSGYHVSSRYNDNNTADVILIMKNTGDSVKVAAWTTGPSHQVTLPLSALSLSGAAKSIHWIDCVSDTGSTQVVSGGITVELTAAPKYFSAFQPRTGVPVPTMPALISPGASAKNVIREPSLKWHSATSYFQISYHVQIATDSTPGPEGAYDPQNVVVDTTLSDTSKLLTQPLDSNTTYYWHVSASDAGGSSKFSPSQSFETGTVLTFPSVPTGIGPAQLATNVTRSGDFTWHKSSRAAQYQLQVANDYPVYLSGDSVGMFLSKNVVVDTTLADTTVRLKTPLDSSMVYFWHVRADNIAGNSAFSTTIKFTTGAMVDAVKSRSGAPARFRLSQNYPNPFNPTTTIEYNLPARLHVTIRVYDILGREVATLVDATQDAGSYRVVFDGSTLASGLYFYRLIAGSHVSTHEMMLIK